MRQHEIEPSKEGDPGSKMVSEIYLPRLLVTKVKWLIHFVVQKLYTTLKDWSLHINIIFFMHLYAVPVYTVYRYSVHLYGYLYTVYMYSVHFYACPFVYHTYMNVIKRVCIT